MRVLLSIKPEFAHKIFDGSKKYEYRRAIFRQSPVTRVILYASHPIKMVVGEFEIDAILHHPPRTLWAKTRAYAGITKHRFLTYFTNKAKGYAIVIKSATRYDTPLPLDSFMVSSPPQSFLYLSSTP